jgi:hypothetical protein
MHTVQLFGHAIRPVFYMAAVSKQPADCHK